MIDVKIGDFVRCGFFVGRVEDVATGQHHTMLLVSSPKGVWRNHGPEWIEYDPEGVTRVTAAEFNEEVDRYRDMVERTFRELEEMRVPESLAAD